MRKAVPSTSFLRAFRASIGEEKLVCSFCRPRKAPTGLRSNYSTRIAPAISVNVQKDIPKEYKNLYTTLTALGKAASVYINVAQLQLALKNLETKNPAVRIAVLGVNDQNGPLQLVRSLLADPLSPEAPWEKELQAAHHDGKPLLIRSGYKVSIDSTHPLLRTLTIPSSLLEQHKVELLLHQVGLEDGASIEPTEEVISTLLTPSLHAQQSFSGRTTSVTYPVHKTLLLENGFGSMLSLAGLLQSREGRTALGMIKIITNVTWDSVPERQNKIFFVNLTKGAHAIQAFRESLKNSITYEREWLSSGMPALSTLLITEKSNPESLRDEVRQLINHILDETDLAITISEAESTKKILAITIPDVKREQIDKAISTWAEKAHSELRAGMANIEYSKAWRKLAWWKLLWRIDDVEMITSEAIRRTYLIEAEKNLVFIAGRIAQAGLVGPDGLQAYTHGSRIFEAELEDQKQLQSENAILSPLIKSEAHSEVTLPGVKSTQVNGLAAWPSQISISRNTILKNTIPPFAASAQRYLLSALSITSLTSLTTALAYFSVSTTSLYEAGTIAAVGLVFSAYRLQKHWENARQQWLTELHIEGKQTLDMVEQQSREVVRDGGKGASDHISLSEHLQARSIIKEVRAALLELQDLKADQISR